MFWFVLVSNGTVLRECCGCRCGGAAVGLSCGEVARLLSHAYEEGTRLTNYHDSAAVSILSCFGEVVHAVYLLSCERRGQFIVCYRHAQSPALVLEMQSDCSSIVTRPQ